MFNIKYEIGLNDTGRPCIILPEDYEHNPEDRFFAIEIARYILQDVYSRRSPDLEINTLTALQESANLLGQLGDEIAEILYNNMKAYGETSLIFDSKYQVAVDNIDERNGLPEKGILVVDKIYDREEGLKVLVTDENKIYVLVNGITNENWKPVDGEL